VENRLQTVDDGRVLLGAGEKLWDRLSQSVGSPPAAEFVSFFPISEERI